MAVGTVAPLAIASAMMLLSSGRSEAVIERTYTLPFSTTSFTISCSWGPYSLCGLSGWHYGTDYVLGGYGTVGDNVVAARSGTAWHHNDFISGGPGKGCGYYIVIAHGSGHRTRHSHLNDRSAGNGASVSRGEIIGHEGSSGAPGAVHLHFDTRHAGTDDSQCCTGTSVDPYAGSYSPGTYFWSTNPPSYYQGTETVGVFRWAPLEWRLSDSNTNPATKHHFIYGSPGDKQVYGDWDGDGDGNIGTFRNYGPPTARWYLNEQLDGSSSEHQFNYGWFSDRPVAGDWFGSGSRPGYYRAEGDDGRWYINYGFDSSPELNFIYGLATDLPVTGDWDCDGDETVGVFRSGEWRLNDELNDPWTDHVIWDYGISGDIPVAGDWDGDNCDSVGVFRPSNGKWYLNNDIDDENSDHILSYGQYSDLPVVGDWNGE
jgi:hypothetical protein